MQALVRSPAWGPGCWPLVAQVSVLSVQQQALVESALEKEGTGLRTLKNECQRVNPKARHTASRTGGDACILSEVHT